MHDPVINSYEQLIAALSRINFHNTVLDFKWKFEFVPLLAIYPAEHGEDMQRKGWLIWVSFERPDSLTGEIGRGRGRDEIIWKGTTLSGVIKTAWLLVELMVRHELMEGFRFDDSRIFNPHHSVLDLAKVQEIHDKRISGELV